MQPPTTESDTVIDVMPPRHEDVRKQLAEQYRTIRLQEPNAAEDERAGLRVALIQTADRLAFEVLRR
jgi:hypothetical protein